MALIALSYQGVAIPGLPTPHQLMAMLDARSPGERPDGALTQSKKRVEHPQRALGKVFRKPPPVEQLAKVVVPPPVQFVPPPEEPIAADIIPPSLLLASLPPVTGDLLNTPFTPVLFVPPPPPPSSSAVPEPGTWMMMLLGFGMLGAAMRGRPPVRARMQAA